MKLLCDSFVQVTIGVTEKIRTGRLNSFRLLSQTDIK